MALKKSHQMVNTLYFNIGSILVERINVLDISKEMGDKWIFPAFEDYTGNFKFIFRNHSLW